MTAWPATERWTGTRVPPHNLDAEESLIGAMLLSPEAVAAGRSRCGVADFHKPAHGHIFNAILALFERGEPVDAVTVADELGDLLDVIGGPTELVELQTNTPSIANAGHYAKIVANHARLRMVIGKSAEAAEAAYSGRLEEAELRLQQAVDELRTDPDDDHGPVPVDWHALFAGDHAAEEWLVEPLLPKSRQVAMYSPAKVGKSLLALEVSAATASGRAVLRQAAGTPASVLYVDLEMTREDLVERLGDLGYGPDGLGSFVYYQAAELPPFDTPEGGRCMARLVDRHQPVLVVIDTMARAVAGPEDASDTYRAFYRWTGRLLRERGVTLLRADHAGKHEDRGQRGSSAKADDVDVVWRLSADKDRLTLHRTHSRVPWVPPELALVREVEPVLHHAVDAGTFTGSAVSCARALDDLAVPIGATAASAMAILKEAGQARRKATVLQALKFRRQ